MKAQNEWLYIRALLCMILGVVTTTPIVKALWIISAVLWWGMYIYEAYFNKPKS